MSQQHFTAGALDRMWHHYNYSEWSYKGVTSQRGFSWVIHHDYSLDLTLYLILEVGMRHQGQQIIIISLPVPLSPHDAVSAPLLYAHPPDDRIQITAL